METEANDQEQEKVGLAEVEIVYHAPRNPNPLKICTSEQAYALLKEVFDKRKMDYKEMFYVLLLNAANICLGYSQIGVGTVVGVSVNVREIFHLALKTNANAIILAHNHPSGSLKASDSDIELSKKVSKGCHLFDVHLLDHIIITSNGYCSMAEDGLV